VRGKPVASDRLEARGRLYPISFYLFRTRN
jgi:hypothetical protein